MSIKQVVLIDSSSGSITDGYGNITFPINDPTPSITQVQQVNSSAPVNMTISPQFAGGSATNATNGTPGNLIINLGPIVNGGSEAAFVVERNGTALSAIGALPGATSYGGLWLSSTAGARTLQNAAVYSNGSQIVFNVPSGGSGVLAYNQGNTIATFTDTSFLLTDPATFGWTADTSSPTITQNTQTSDAATNALTITSQAPFASATVNKAPGTIVLNTPAPISGGAHGTVSFRDGGTEYISISNTAGTSPTISCTGAGEGLTISSPNGQLTIGSAGIPTATLGSGWFFNTSNVNFRDASFTNWATFNATSTPNLTIAQAATSFTLTQAQQANASAPANMTIAPQAPGAGASSTSTGTPGSLIINLPIPVSTGAEAGFKVQRNGSTFLSAQQWTAAGGFYGLYLGTITPGSTNFTLLGDNNNTYVNAPSGTIQLNIGGATEVTVGTTQITVVPQVITWSQATSSPELAQAQQANASAPQNMFLIPQVPGASATNATNGTPGSLIVSLSAPVNGGSEAALKVSRSGGTNTFIQTLPSFPSIAGLFMGVTTPSSTNYALLSDGTTTYLNASGSGNILFNAANVTVTQLFPSGQLQYATATTTPQIIQASTSSGSGVTMTIQAQGATGASNNGGNLNLSSGTSGSATVGTLNLQTGGTTQFAVSPTTITQTSSTYQFTQGTSSPIIQQAQQANGSNPNNLTLAPQAPGAGAASTATGTPGSLIVNLAAPVSTGNEAFFQVQKAGTTLVQFGHQVNGGGGAGAIYGPVVPSQTNASLYVLNNDTYLNAPTSTVHLSVNLVDQVAITTSAITLTPASMSWVNTTSSPTITQSTAASDVATNALTITSQAPFASATVNKAPGTIILNTPAPISGGAHGTVSFRDGGTEYISISNVAGNSPTISCTGAGEGLTISSPNGQLTIGSAATATAALCSGWFFNTSNVNFRDASFVNWATFNATSTPNLTVVAGATSFNLTQASTSSGSGATMTVQAQGATGASNNGGNLNLSGGTSGSATAGYVQLQTGGSTVATFGNAGLQTNSTSVAITTGTTTLTAAQYAFGYIILTGSLSGDVTVVFPATVGAQWIVDATAVTLNGHHIQLQANSNLLGANTTITTTNIFHVIYGGTGRLYQTTLSS